MCLICYSICACRNFRFLFCFIEYRDNHQNIGHFILRRLLPLFFPPSLPRHFPCIPTLFVAPRPLLFLSIYSSICAHCEIFSLVSLCYKNISTDLQTYFLFLRVKGSSTYFLIGSPTDIKDKSRSDQNATCHGLLRNIPSSKLSYH